MNFTGDYEFFQECEDARQEVYELSEQAQYLLNELATETPDSTDEEIFEFFLNEAGNNGEPVLNPDAHSMTDADFIEWKENNGF